jgi:hypothetical protein
MLERSDVEGPDGEGFMAALSKALLEAEAVDDEAAAEGEEPAEQEKPTGE